MKTPDLIATQVEGAPVNEREAGDKVEKRGSKAFGALLAQAVDHERKGAQEGASARPLRATGELREAPSTADASEPQRDDERAPTIVIPGRALPIHESISRAGTRVTTPREPQPEPPLGPQPEAASEQEATTSRVQGETSPEGTLEATRALEEEESARDAGLLVTALGNVAAVIAKIVQPLGTSAAAVTASGPAAIGAIGEGAQPAADLQTDDSPLSEPSEPFVGSPASDTRKLPLSGYRRAAMADVRPMEAARGGLPAEMLGGMEAATDLPTGLAAHARAAAQAGAGMPASQPTYAVVSPVIPRQGPVAAHASGAHEPPANATSVPLRASASTAAAHEPSPRVDLSSSSASPSGPAGSAAKAQVVFSHSTPTQAPDAQTRDAVRPSTQRNVATTTGELTKSSAGSVAAKLSGAASATPAANRDGKLAPSLAGAPGSRLPPAVSGASAPYDTQATANVQPAANAQPAVNAQLAVNAQPAANPQPAVNAQTTASAAQPAPPAAVAAPTATPAAKRELDVEHASASATTTQATIAQAPRSAAVAPTRQLAVPTMRSGDVADSQADSPKARGVSDPMTRVHGFTRGALVGHAMSAYAGRGHEGGEHDSGSRGARSDDTGDVVRAEERAPVESFVQGFDHGPVQHAPQVTAEAPAAPAVLAAPQAPVQTPNELPDFEFAARPPANQPEAASISLHHPDLGPIQLEVHRERGRVEVHAVIESAHAAAVLRANESGIRQGVQQSGLNFSALRVRMRDEEPQQTRPAPVRRRRTNNQKEA